MKQSAKGKKWKPTMFIQQPDYMTGNVNVQNEYRFFIDFYNDRGGGEHIMDEKEKTQAEATDEDKNQDDQMSNQEHENITEDFIKKISDEQMLEEAVIELDQMNDKNLQPVEEHGTDTPDVEGKLNIEESEEDDTFSGGKEFSLVNQEVVETDGKETGETHIEEMNEARDATEESLDEEKLERRREIRQLVRRLAFYPNVLERPVCEAKINGDKVWIQILSKRGDQVRIRRNRKIETIHIDEIEELEVQI
jgi:hypothetical protein